MIDLPRIVPRIAIIGMTQGMVAIVDEADLAIIEKFHWRAAKVPGVDRCYALASYVSPAGRRSTVRMHRAIMGARRGQIVDHINGDGLDNRRANLRFATASENAANSRRHSDNTSGFKGVTFDRRKSKWSARVQFKGARIWGGYFDSAEEAFAKYAEYASEMQGQFARLK